jgi:PAS domain-containing protein
MQDHQSTAAIWEGRHLRLAIDAAGVALFSWNVQTDRLTMDDIAYRLWGIPRGDNVTFEDLSANIHPADRDRVRAAFVATRGMIGAYADRLAQALSPSQIKA